MRNKNGAEETLLYQARYSSWHSFEFNKNFTIKSFVHLRHKILSRRKFEGLLTPYSEIVMPNISCSSQKEIAINFSIL